ncbi:Replicase polyprotein 1ab [Frankliniella fusca]|uniref:Replicase polyprotein 1ab n=1 Tax=Frankliniella fusca TaxID=407009 RepID=A0AAE1H7W7_9NEOP|nr:Replicase polyprotein 1ab [Frankliniella fusca]
MFWIKKPSNQLNPLQRLQNRVIKLIFGFHYRHSSIDLYSSLEIMPIRSIVNQASATFSYLVINKKEELPNNVQLQL